MKETYSVQGIKGAVGKEFIKQHHYSHGCHNGPMTWGLFDEDRLIGVCAFATPCSENVRRSVFGDEYKDHVTELHRLVVLDETPRNTETWFIRRALNGLKADRSHIWAVISFADSSEGHSGIIYQASNFMYYGTTGMATFYRDETGRLRHPRQNGHNITKEDAERYNWTAVRRESKHRYCIFLPDNKGHKRYLERLCKLETRRYPK